MSIQLEGNFVGSITAIEHVVVDKVGLYAYSLHSNKRKSTTNSKGFQNALIVNIQTQRRTKVISVQTPYRLVNKSRMPLQFKVCSSCPIACLHLT